MLLTCVSYCFGLGSTMTGSYRGKMTNGCILLALAFLSLAQLMHKYSDPASASKKTSTPIATRATGNPSQTLAVKIPPADPDDGGRCVVVGGGSRASGALI